MKNKRLFETPWKGLKVTEPTIKEIDRRLKKNPTLTPTWKRVDGVPEVRGDRVEVSIVASQSRDLDDEVLLIDPINRELFLQHPLVCWDHDYAMPPLGHSAWIEPDIRNAVPVMLAMTKYRSSPFVDDVWSCMTNDPCLLPYKSVGFLSNKRPPSKDELAEHPDWKGAMICYDALLLEYSVVVLPANFDCVLQQIGPESELGKRLPARTPKPAPKRMPNVGKALEKAVAQRLAEIDVDEIVRGAMQKMRYLR